RRRLQRARAQQLADQDRLDALPVKVTSRPGAAHHRQRIKRQLTTSHQGSRAAELELAATVPLAALVDAVGRGQRAALALLTTTTVGVHHRCITSAALGGSRRNQGSTETA